MKVNMRLDKFLAEAALGNRKTVREYVKAGTVTVNNQIISNPAAEIEDKIDIIKYLGKEVIHKGTRYYMFHKPGGCITARKDEHCLTVLDYFDINSREGLFPVGRLDKDTEGLLLLTNDGEFNHGLMHPGHHIEKTYFFWVLGELNNLAKERIMTGINIGVNEALARATNVEVDEVGQYQELHERMILSNNKDISINPYHQPVTSGYITITEGRKHQVKRMLKAVGCYVIYLKRVSIGGVALDQTLEKGQYRELTEAEIRKLTLY
jgi:16S rRNA pseudouridine516 synthase